MDSWCLLSRLKVGVIQQFLMLLHLRLMLENKSNTRGGSLHRLVKTRLTTSTFDLLGETTNKAGITLTFVVLD